jgi:hypothetical protein
LSLQCIKGLNRRTEGKLKLINPKEQIATLYQLRYPTANNKVGIAIGYRLRDLILSSLLKESSKNDVNSLRGDLEHEHRYTDVMCCEKVMADILILVPET